MHAPIYVTYLNGLDVAELVNKLAGKVESTKLYALTDALARPEAYLPKIYERDRVDAIVSMPQQLAEDTMRELARKEGIFCGVSSGGAVAAALELSQQVENAVIVAIICDRGDRYLSSGLFNN